MTNALNGPRIKLRRARAHLDDLQQRIASYFATNPFAIEAVDEAGTGDRVFRVRVLASVPEDMGAVIGDVVHNARAALDLIIWQAVLANGGNPKKATASRSPRIRPLTYKCARLHWRVPPPMS